MDDYFWRSLATPVLVALVTTLVVEYAAKPRLEARKARIIRSRAEVDELVYSAQRLGLLAGSLPNSAQLRANPSLGAYAQAAIADMASAADDASLVLSRLSVRYMVSHRQHIARTAVFLGFLRSACVSGVDDPISHADDLKSLVGDLEHFDVYFRVHLGLRDSQEPLLKRLFWRVASENDYAKAAGEVLERRGLPVPGGDDH